MQSRKIALASALALAAAFALGSCAPKPAPALKFGILPDTDSLPFMAAAAQGLFEKHGVQVELVRFTSPVERDAAFQAGAVDGVISDLVAAALAVRGGFGVKVVSVTDGRYGVAAAPGGATGMAALKGQAVGLSTNTIIQYLVDSAAARAGLAPQDIQRTAVPKIPVRMELLLGGQVAAAGLPEPFLTVAKSRGAVVVASCEDYGLDAGVVLFDAKALDAKAESVRRLLQAYWQAASDINAKPDSYRDFLVSDAKFPADVRDVFRFVTYRKPILPAAANVEAALAWMRSIGILEGELDPASLLDDRALRGW